MDNQQFQLLVLACTQPEGTTSSRKYDEESFAQRVIAEAMKDCGGSMRLDVAASMVHDLVCPIKSQTTSNNSYSCS
jgi:hypothetical protein